MGISDTPTFNDRIEAHHERIDPDQYDGIVVVGDVHGCRETLERLLNRLTKTPNTLVVFVGDLIRKGPDSHGVLSLVRRESNLVSVRGNNEAKVLRGEKTVSGLTPTDRSFIERLPVAISWPGNLVVHGGIDPRKSLADHSMDDLLEMRSFDESHSYERPFWFERYEGSPRVFFGHTVLDRPFRTPSVVGLDTGCVYGGSLTAYVVDQSRFVRADPPTVYQSRGADTIVTPRKPSCV